MDFSLPRYTVRRKVFKFFGASFHVFDANERVVGFSDQKAFRLREDIRVFTDESRTTELLIIRARQMIDFGASYDVVDPREGTHVGILRRKGLQSLVRDSWEVLDPAERPLARLQEDSLLLSLIRRVASNLVPQAFHLRTPDDTEVARMKVRFNPFVYRLDVEVRDADRVDGRLVLATAILLAAIEGRQD